MSHNTTWTPSNGPDVVVNVITLEQEEKACSSCSEFCLKLLNRLLSTTFPEYVWKIMNPDSSIVMSSIVTAWRFPHFWKKCFMCSCAYGITVQCTDIALHIVRTMPLHCWLRWRFNRLQRLILSISSLMYSTFFFCTVLLHHFFVLFASSANELTVGKVYAALMIFDYYKQNRARRLQLQQQQNVSQV